MLIHTTALFTMLYMFLSVFFRLSLFFPCQILAHSHHQNAAIASISKGLVFPDFKGNRMHDIKMLGSARISEESGCIRIPGSLQEDGAGRALYWSPLRMLDPETGTPASFDTTFSFVLHTTSALHVSRSPSSGLAFLIVPDEVTVGRAGAWLGMMNDACDETSKPFAVEFDSFKDDEFMDPNDNHVGLNLGSIISNQTADAAFAGVSFKDGSAVRAWINYDSSSSWMEVRVAKEGVEKPVQPLLSGHADLSNIFKEYMFVGFSAATGNGAQVHNILSWNFSSQAKAKLRFPVEDQTCQKQLGIHKESGSNSRRRTPLGFIIFLVVTLLLSILILNFVCIGCYKKSKKEDPYMLKLSPRPLNHKPRRFSLKELSHATKDFSGEEILGSGERSAFFRGVLPDGAQLAIKRFSPEYLKTCININKLVKEIAFIARLQHPNLVPLRGWCYEKGELLLVYEYMPNESIDNWLYCKWVLPWPRRYKIVREVASALAYLHSTVSKRRVVHQDVKTSNVFLDVTFRARLGDFGLFQNKNRADSTVIMSDSDCLTAYARRYSGGGKATTEVDVYGFGVMVLEMVAGRKTIEEELIMGKEGRDLVAWAWLLKEKGKLLDIVDKRLGVRYSQEQAISLLEVGLLCTQLDPQARPSMDMVVKSLSQTTSFLTSSWTKGEGNINEGMSEP